MVEIIVFTTFVASLFLALLVLRFLYKERLIVEGRLSIFTTIQQKSKYIDEKLDKPLVERFLRPLLKKLGDKFNSAMPTKKSVSVQQKLNMAGNPGGLTVNEFVVIKNVLAIGLAILGAFIVLAAGDEILRVILFGLLGFVAGLILPDQYLKIRGNSRQADIQRSLPDILDLLTVSVEAGLGFDSALSKVVEKTRGVMSDEFMRVLQEIKMGKPRRDALRDLGVRLGNDDLQTFIGAIIQADQLGVSIGNVLRLQSEQMRIKRQQRAEEKAMKAPIKMLIPLVVFIFPTLFVVLLGPAVLRFLIN